MNSKVGSELGKELIGISIDGVSEKGITEINNFINGKKSRLEHILSEENMRKEYVAEENIDFVIAELKHLLSKVEITDELIRVCRYNPEDLKDFLWSEYRRNKNIIENESDIEKGLDAVAKTLIELVRESEEFEKNLLIQISNTVDDANIEIKKISDYMHKNYGSMNEEIQMILVIVQMILEQIHNKDSKENDIKREEKFKNNKKQDYIDNWNSRLFLHLDNEERAITLADAFIMPEFDYCMRFGMIEFSDDDNMEDIIGKFLNYNRTSAMLILGDPGIGKTSITSWIANKYENNSDIIDIIIIRFRDWESEELEKGLWKAIYNTLGCEKKDLKDKILIIDGYDEIKNTKRLLLNKFFNSLLDFNNFKLIITSRVSYISEEYFHYAFKLLPFNIERMERFYEIITGDELDKEKISCENLDILGISVILYMAIMSNIDITENNTKPELYNRIFAERGGIFDRFCYRGVGYDAGANPLRDRENIKKYLDFLQNMAFTMFERNSLSIKREDCQIPTLDFLGNEISVLEFPIKHFFENVETNIEFIHKSIYEYFVSEYIFMSICKGLDLSVNKFAGKLGKLLKSNKLSFEILEFLRYKIKNSILIGKFNLIRDAFQVMLQDGMTFHTKKYYKNVVERELCIFANMLEIIHL